MLSAESILETLDVSASLFIFPMLDNGYVYLAATRLSVFRSSEDWALVFEIFGFSPRACEPSLSITTIGSCIAHNRAEADFVDARAHRAYLENNRNWDMVFFAPIEDVAWIDSEGETVDPTATHLMLRGERVPIPGSSEYRDARIALSEPQIRVFELCRALAYTHREKVLATQTERRVGLCPGLVPLLVLDDWEHPDVVDSDVLPSQSAAFRQIADAIVSGDASSYTPGRGNTHWSNWPDGGTL